jgi:hypothetical protein
MTALRSLALLAGLAVVAGCTQGEAATGTTTALTEPQVRAMLERFEGAAYTPQEDEVMGAALADDVRIVWRTPGEPDEAMDKDTFLSDVDDLEDMHYAYRIDTIEVAADGQSATAEVAADESFSVDGVQYAMTYDQDYRIELRDGVPLIVSLTGDETSLAIDGEKQY